LHDRNTDDVFLDARVEGSELPNQIDHLSTLVPSFRAHGAAEAIGFIKETMTRWATGRPGRAYLELPVDVLEGASDVMHPEDLAWKPPVPLQPDIEEPAAEAQTLGHPTTTVIVAGGGYLDVARGCLVKGPLSGLDLPDPG
jgi:hypothetical protein